MQGRGGSVVKGNCRSDAASGGHDAQPAIEGTIDMGGGIPILAGNEVIGAIAVSGAPGWDQDEVRAAKPDWPKSRIN